MTEDTKIPKNRSRRIGIIIAVTVVVLCLSALIAFVFKDRIGGLGRKINFNSFTLVKNTFPDVTGTSREAFDVTTLHAGHRSEWWYVNTHLVDPRGRRFTLMLTYLKPGSIYGILASVDRQRGIPIFLHERLEIDPANRSYGGANFKILQPDPEAFCYKVVSDHPSGKVDLILCANKRPLQVGGDGMIKMGREGESYYFSLTNMTASGTVAVGNSGPIEVKGRGWLDRQWGNWDVDDFDQWQWFSIQLFNNVEIMIFNFIRAGRTVSPICDIVYPDGSQEHNLRRKLTVLDNWVSPKTEVSWSSGWEIEIPSRKIKLTVLPDFPDQEINSALWEGGCTVQGVMDGKKVYGRAFYEERRRTWEDRRRELQGKGVHY